MSTPTLRRHSLKTRLTVTMAVLLGVSLALNYLLALQAERRITGEVERSVQKAQDEVNACLQKVQASQAPEATSGPVERRWFQPVTRRERPGTVVDLQALFDERVRWMLRNLDTIQRDLERRKSHQGPFICIKLGYGKKKVTAGPFGREAEGVRASTIGGTHGFGRPIPTWGTERDPAPDVVAGVSREDVSDDRGLEVSFPMEPVQEQFRGLRLQEVLISLGVFILGIVLSWALATHFTSPLRHMSAAFGRVAAGDLRGTPLPRRKDEIGTMGESFQVMLEKMRENRELEMRVFEQERFSTLGHLAAGVAHDIRNPLNAIGLTIDHMQDEFCPDDVEKRESFLRFTAAIRAEIARLDALVNNFLSLARPSSLDVRPNDLNEIVRDLLSLIRNEAESRGVSICTELDPDLPAVPLDAERIRAAIMNLILNALQAMDGGGQVLIRTRAVEGEAHLIVEDNGRGIAPDDLEKVFLPYYTTREEGTGLGLTVCRATVEGHGGRIDLRSEVGRGTTMTVILPLHSTAPKR